MDEHMRFLLSTLTIQFRPTLTYFNRRESIMGNYHPRNFKNWMRGDKHFVLINSDDRRAIRFEPNKLIVRVEGHNSADMFDEGVGFAYQMLDDFNDFSDFNDFIRARPVPKFNSLILLKFGIYITGNQNRGFRFEISFFAPA